ncbi:terminal EAR1-like 1 [Striga hermonthica]|uniref:Terminal EAR1-like 1 n=1 Tax=Striga hermonthica TaxID=68872 RepID=A0A9N7R567_STRHE|nr:terminal EAR1-like 1 [Striga hermonthica]
MAEPGFSRFPGHHLDPAAQEFFPTATLIYYPYPPPPPPGYARPPQFPPPPPPPPASLPPPSPAPSRTLLLSMVPASVSESAVRRELEVFGDVRAVQMERRREGLVTVHFYDVRDAQSALAAVQEQHMQQQYRLGRHYEAVFHNSMVAPPPLPPQSARGLIQGRVVWAQFTAPVTSLLPDGNNQGTLVIFNLDPHLPAAYLTRIFEAFGPVKELRETPNKRNQIFVEFYDVRDAARALSEMNGKQIYGKSVVIEYSRAGGHFCKKFPKCPQLPTCSSKLPPPNTSPPAAPSSRTVTHQELLIANNNNNSSNRKKMMMKNKNESSTSSVGVEDGGSSGGGGGCGGGCRAWKGGRRGGGKERDDPRFLINDSGKVEDHGQSDSDWCRDPRTTVMIKNIPNKYSQKLLLNMLDNHCIHCNEQIANDAEQDQPLSSYDFVYLPIDFINKCNVGYGFVNMTSPQATMRLYKAFHHQNWEVFNSRKICQVTYARLQGIEALREHFKNSKFPGEAEEYMPVVFSPPRDGRILSEPVPITIASTSSSSKEKDESQPRI